MCCTSPAPHPHPRKKRTISVRIWFIHNLAGNMASAEMMSTLTYWHTSRYHVDCSSSFSNFKCPNMHSVSISDNTGKKKKNICNCMTMIYQHKMIKKNNKCLFNYGSKTEIRTECMIEIFLPQSLSFGLCWWAGLQQWPYDHFSPDPIPSLELNSWVYCNKYMNMNTEFNKVPAPELLTMRFCLEK